MIDNLEKCLMDTYSKAISEIAEEKKLRKQYYDGYYSGLREMKDRFSEAIKQTKENKE